MKSSLFRIVITFIISTVLSAAGANGPLIMPSDWLAWGSGALNKLNDPLNASPPMLERFEDPAGILPTFCLNPPEGYRLSLSLMDAIDLAACRNPQARIAWINIKTQAATLGEARSAYLPTFTVSQNRLTTTTVFPANNNLKERKRGTTINANLNWRLWDFGKRAHNEFAAENLLNSAILNHESALIKVISTVIQNYFSAMSAQNRMAALLQDEQRSADIYQTILRREKLGAASQVDILQAKSVWARAQLSAQLSIGENKKAVAQLKQALAIDQNELELSDSLALQAIPSKDELQKKIAWARQNHPAILSAKAQLSAARAKTASAVAEGLPYIEASATYNENGYPGQALQTNNSKITTYGINLVMPVFDGFLQNYRVRGAEAQAEQKEEELNDISFQINAELSRLETDFETSIANIQYAEAWVTASQAFADGIKRRFEKGTSNNVEVLQAEQQYSEAKQELVKQRANWLTTHYQFWITTRSHLEPLKH